MISQLDTLYFCLLSHSWSHHRLFENDWNTFASLDQKEVTRIPGLNLWQRRKLIHYLTLFNHGLFPRVWDSRDQEEGKEVNVNATSQTAAAQQHGQLFAGRKYANEGQEWTSSDEDRLRAAGSWWDAGFGDPWMYLSHELH